MSGQPISGLSYTEIETTEPGLPIVLLAIRPEALPIAGSTVEALVMHVEATNLVGRDEVVRLLRATADTLLITGLGQEDSQPVESREQVDSTPAHRPFNPQPRGKTS